MQETKPKISVIIPVFNREKTISRAIDSVLSQTYPAYEIIVIDDASSDKTAKILQTYIHEIKIISLNLNSGVSAARNQGIAIAKGDWIAFLDSDDEWFKNKLELQVEYLKKHPEIVILQSDEQWIRYEKKVNPPRKYVKKGGEIFKNCLKTCIVGPSTILIKKSIFNEVGVFDESLPVCEDYDLWLRISAKYTIPLIDKKLINKYGGHSDQLSTTVPALDRYRVQSLEKIYYSLDLNPDQKKALLDELVLKLGYLYEGAKRRGEGDAFYKTKFEKFQTIRMSE